jgi:phage-related protein
MFMHIVTQLSGQITALFTQALASLKALLCKLVNNLRVNITRAYQNVVSLFSPLVLTLSKIKALVASLITQVQSIKQGLKLVVTTSGQIGSQLLTTVRQIPQAVIQAFKKGQ